MTAFYNTFAGMVSHTTVIASGDFTNIASSNAADGVYTLNGTPCALGDIIDLSFPDNTFNPATDLDANGIKPRPSENSTNSLYLKNPLLGQILSGFTAVFDVAFFSVAVEGGWSLTQFAAASFDYPDYGIQPSMVALWGIGDSPSDRISFSSPDGNNNADFSGKLIVEGIHRIAITATAGGVSGSVDGGAVFSTTAFAGVDPGCDGFLFSIGGDVDSRLRSFAFYEVVDDADLPSLSAL